MKGITIRDIKTYVTAPRGINLVVVKVETSEPELYGLGCATFTWRHKAVVTAIEEYLRPMLKGRNVQNIEDIWQTMMGSSYWRNGPVLNNAISGVDEALWDIKGKLANMPVYDLLGGKCREGLSIYRHADGDSIEEMIELVHQYREEGLRYVRCQAGTYGGNRDGKFQEIIKPDNAPKGAYFHPRQYMQSVVEMMEKVRDTFGWELEIMHDVHERLPIGDTLQFAKELEPFKLFFLEDSLPPDQGDYYKYLREQTSVPLAVGELFSHPLEWRTIVQNQWIDFIRCHISFIGGITPAQKLAHFCEAYSVRTAWHGPNDISPIGVAAQMHLDLVSHNFGVQEIFEFTPEEREIFPHSPIVKNGYAYLNDRPGIGVEFDEEVAKKYPETDMDHSWLFSRLPDGTAVRP